MHRWIDNFDTVTTSGIAEDATPDLSAFLSVEDLARIETALANPDDFIELTLIAAGVVEILIAFADGTIVRNGGLGGSATAWLAGSRIVASLSAVSVARFHSGGRASLSSPEDTITLSGRSETWEWNPLGDDLTIHCVFDNASIDATGLDTLVDIVSPDSVAPLDLRIDGWVLDGIKLPAGATGSFVSDHYQIALPAAAKYRLTFKGIAFFSLEISDFSEFTLTS